MRIERVRKFRAYDIREERYLYKEFYDRNWYIAEDSAKCVKGLMPDDEKQQILEEFTGLKDKNGKPIYEGDILKDEYGIGVIRYHPGMAAFVVVIKESEVFWINPTGVCRKEFGGIQLQYSEVIGNENENPELLEK